MFWLIFWINLAVRFVDGQSGHRRPKLMPMPEENHSIQNLSHVFLCNLLHGTQPIQFEWTKNGRKLSRSSSHPHENGDHRISNQNPSLNIHTTNTSSMLTLMNLNSIDSGVYKCLARNSFGFDQSFTKLFVHSLFEG
ncbi:hypothetical protein NH340_JMT07329 [Sarcoptes scabiei]|nr:hypothetical protein NH340_JMT07329 [Sarcoptes scabiei]